VLQVVRAAIPVAGPPTALETSCAARTLNAPSEPDGTSRRVSIYCGLCDHDGPAFISRRLT